MHPTVRLLLAYSSSAIITFALTDALYRFTTGALYRGFSGWQVFTTCPLGDHEQCVDPGVYALLGATAVLSGYTRMTSCVPTSLIVHPYVPH